MQKEIIFLYFIQTGKKMTSIDCYFIYIYIYTHTHIHTHIYNIISRPSTKL